MSARRHCLLAIAFPGALAACNDPRPAPPDLAPGETDPTLCSPLVTQVPDEGAMHVMPDCTRITYRSNPPASGSHWAWRHDWGAYDDVIPRERWVHNLEHGGVVFLFNCGATLPPDECGPDGGAPADLAGWPCPAITTPLRQLIAERSPDEFGEVRLLLTSDPLAPHAVSAVAWDWLYQSDRIDMAALRCFRDRRYGQGPEHAP